MIQPPKIHAFRHAVDSIIEHQLNGSCWAGERQNRLPRAVGHFAYRNVCLTVLKSALLGAIEIFKDPSSFDAERAQGKGQVLQFGTGRQCINTTTYTHVQTGKGSLRSGDVVSWRTMRGLSMGTVKVFFGTPFAAGGSPPLAGGSPLIALVASHKFDATTQLWIRQKDGEDLSDDVQAVFVSALTVHVFFPRGRDLFAESIYVLM